MAGDGNHSDDAFVKATGHDRAHWYAIMDEYPRDLVHKERVLRLGQDAPEVPLWWQQMITVDYERARGIRVLGQSCEGDFQVSCSKTTALDPLEVWDRMMSTDWLPGAVWEDGARWEAPGASVEVRRVDPGKMLRWFWDDGESRSTVEVDFWPTKSGKTSVTFRHHKLAAAEAREVYRGRWKEALAQILA